VWKAERHNDEEQKKIEILKKEMAEEQQIYELKKLHQEATGKYVPFLRESVYFFPFFSVCSTLLTCQFCRRVERLDWMYDGNVVAGGERTTAEEYLLGKKYEGDKEQEELGKVCHACLRKRVVCRLTGCHV
jgi:hypothetical protein